MIRGQGHWTALYFKQTLTTKQLKEYLLNEPRDVIYKGVIVPLIHTHLGAGVWELKKDLKHYNKIMNDDVYIPRWY